MCLNWLATDWRPYSRRIHTYKHTISLLTLSVFLPLTVTSMFALLPFYLRLCFFFLTFLIHIGRGTKITITQCSTNLKSTPCGHPLATDRWMRCLYMKESVLTRLSICTYKSFTVQNLDKLMQTSANVEWALILHIFEVRHSACSILQLVGKERIKAPCNCLSSTAITCLA